MLPLTLPNSSNLGQTCCGDDQGRLHGQTKINTYILPPPELSAFPSKDSISINTTLDMCTSRAMATESNFDNKRARWAFVIGPNAVGRPRVLRRMARFVRKTETHHVLSDEILKEKAPTYSKYPEEENLSAPQDMHIPHTESTTSQILQPLAISDELQSHSNLEHQPDDILRHKEEVSIAKSRCVEPLHVSAEEYDWLSYLVLLEPSEEVSFPGISEIES
ncbi:hypothetical protein L211DRAFT_881602 [Terfezia boudieri ATCC MYA-4762]|uniref:Uncharacterized protein n=1 Tax=Terfezia boudieri ATCC MYA-4762 TaxID=1051890 RepID=A0A3N4M8H9_9PEZI|nr:hypothetical protein L211DRAFT_881602 [Terfezia boudieri ATCC MYA-4762]